LTATPGYSLVSLVWSASTGATSYNVKRSTQNGGPYAVIAPGLTTLLYSDSGLTNGQPYYYVVSANNSVGEGPDSVQVSAIPNDAVGALDTNFGVGGGVAIAINSFSCGANAVALQSDGQIVFGGFSSNGTKYDFAVGRLNANGLIGTGDGAFATSLSPADDVANAMVIQPDGKVVLAGYATFATTNLDFALVRYNVDGSLDSTFGSGGIVTTAIGSLNDIAYGLVLQTDGKLVAAGYSRGSTNDEFAVVRYNPDGSLDSTFGSGGIVTTFIGTNGSQGNAVALQPDGKIVLAGYSIPATGDQAVALVRYNTDGSLDPTFGTAGIVTTNIGPSTDTALCVAIQPDGMIVAGGYTVNGSNPDIALLRYSASGSLDSTFGSGGIVITAIGSGGQDAAALVLQPNGKIVVAGYADVASNTDFAMARYQPNGLLDTTFGNGGTLVIPGTGLNYLQAAVLQPDGGIVVAGSTGGSPYRIAVLRIR
jgi:uncharacterized delta-60 repeat protein